MNGEKRFRSATIEKKAINEESRTVELSFSSEAPYERSFGIEILWHDQDSVDLSRLRNGAPVLVNHDPNQVAGVVEEARVDSDRVGRAVVRIAADIIFPDTPSENPPHTGEVGAFGCGFPFIAPDAASINPRLNHFRCDIGNLCLCADVVSEIVYLRLTGGKAMLRHSHSGFRSYKTRSRWLIIVILETLVWP